MGVRGIFFNPSSRTFDQIFDKFEPLAAESATWTLAITQHILPEVKATDGREVDNTIFFFESKDSISDVTGSTGCLVRNSVVIGDPQVIRVSLQIKPDDSRGKAYRFGDFIVRKGILQTNGAFRGIIIDVEYIPCCYKTQCDDLLQEFIAGFSTPEYKFERKHVDYSNTKLGSTYEVSHLIYDYVQTAKHFDLFN